MANAMMGAASTAMGAMPATGGKGGALPNPTPFPYPSAPSVAPQWNVNTAAAQGLQGAMRATGNEMNYRPMAVQASQYNPASMQATGYNAATGQATGYNAATAGSQGYNAANAGSQGYNASGINAGQLANTNMAAYMNPYEANVIGGLQSDAARSAEMASNQLGAQATAAKAFGGSRHGVAEGVMQAENQRNLNNQIAGLRQAGFQNAQQMGLADIGNRMTADQFSASAMNQAGQFGAAAANQAAMQNAAAQNQARQFGAGASNQAALQNQAALNAARQFGAGAQNTMTSQNLAALNQAGQFGASAANQAATQNQAAMNQAGQYNAGNRMTAQQLNQQAGLAGSQQRLGAANQMGNLSNLGFGMGQTINQNMMSQGAMQQALQQMVMDRGAAQFANYQQSPYQSLAAYSQALGASPSPATATETSSPGLFDYLSLGALGYGMR